MAMVAMVALAIFGLAACGDTNTAQPTPVTGEAVETPVVSQPQQPTFVPKERGNSVQITLREWAIVPNNLGIPPGEVEVTVVNEGDQPHNLTILQGETEIARTPDFTKTEGPKTLDLDLAPGTYRMICSIPGHPEAGMTGTLTVTP